ncbi:MAG: hypothetical protein LN567_06335 [Rickettsia endosymbiont of Graphium doson]|nr:hypothetical protein [Rickettsia endosymbiont of Graphium doson]
MINLRKYQVHMKLQIKFKVLEPTAFGPWLAAFKKLFSPEELDQDINDIYPDEIKEDSEKITELRDKINEINTRLLHVNGEIEGKEEIEEELSKLEKKWQILPVKHYLFYQIR